MYSEALQGIDQSQSKKKIELLQKLGDSQQGAGRFKESLATYELLLKAQLEGDCREVEKIVTYLRLAKAHYSCDQQQEAEITFKTVYKLSKSLLPPKHVLQRSVAGCYADWLAKTGGDKNLMASLRAEVKAAEETGPETTEPASTQGVLISRAPSIKHPSASAPNSPDVSAKAAELLSQEIESELKGVDFPSEIESPIQVTGLSAEAIGKSAQAKETDTASRAIVPLSAVKSDAEGSLGSAWSNLPLRPQNAMRGSARSYFKDGTQSTAEIDKLMLEERSWPKRLVTLIPVVICAAVFGLIVTSAVNEPNSKELPPVFQALVGKTFATTDNTLSLFASSAGFTIRGDGLKKTVKPMIWKGSFSDEMRLIRGEYNKCIWITPVATGLQDQTGLLFLDETSEESKTVRAMSIIAAGAQSYFQNNGRYPVPAEAKTLFTYRNPNSNAVEPVQAFSAISYNANAGTRNEKLEVHLQRGELFEKESSPKPGSVSMLSIINKPNGMIELPNQRVQCQIAYLHAFDRKGELINCPISGNTLVLSLRQGITDRPQDKSIIERYSNAVIGVAQGSLPSSGAVLLKYIGCILLVIALAIYLFMVKRAAGVDS